MRVLWKKILPLAMALMVGAAVSGSAATGDWSVAQMSGKVTIAAVGAQPVALTRGAVLQSGSILATGAASRAFLTRSQETMSIGPNAAVAIPGGSNNRQYTTILQNAGVVEFSVEKQNVQHFAVETPYLAAVVKGTQFSVEVSGSGGIVKVTRGIVEVTALATGEIINVTAGQTALVKPDGTLLFAGPGPVPQAIQGRPRAPAVGSTFASIGKGASSGLNAGIGSGGITASLGLGGVSAGVEVGDDGISAGASVGGLGVGAEVNAGGIGVSVAGASASVGGGGVQVDAGVASASVGGGGVQVDAGPAGLGIDGGGISVDLGGIHLGR